MFPRALVILLSATSLSTAAMLPAAAQTAGGVEQVGKEPVRTIFGTRLLGLWQDDHGLRWNFIEDGYTALTVIVTRHSTGEEVARARYVPGQHGMTGDLVMGDRSASPAKYGSHAYVDNEGFGHVFVDPAFLGRSNRGFMLRRVPGVAATTQQRSWAGPWRTSRGILRLRPEMHLMFGFTYRGEPLAEAERVAFQVKDGDLHGAWEKSGVWNAKVPRGDTFLRMSTDGKKITGYYTDVDSGRRIEWTGERVENPESLPTTPDNAERLPPSADLVAKVLGDWRGNNFKVAIVRTAAGARVTVQEGDKAPIHSDLYASQPGTLQGVLNPFAGRGHTPFRLSVSSTGRALIFSDMLTTGQTGSEFLRVDRDSVAAPLSLEQPTAALADRFVGEYVEEELTFRVFRNSGMLYLSMREAAGQSQTGRLAASKLDETIDGVLNSLRGRGQTPFAIRLSQDRRVLYLHERLADGSLGYRLVSAARVGEIPGPVGPLPTTPPPSERLLKQIMGEWASSGVEARIYSDANGAFLSIKWPTSEAPRIVKLHESSWANSAEGILPPDGFNPSGPFRMMLTESLGSLYFFELLPGDQVGTQKFTLDRKPAGQTPVPASPAPPATPSSTPAGQVPTPPASPATPTTSSQPPVAPGSGSNSGDATVGGFQPLGKWDVRLDRVENPRDDRLTHVYLTLRNPASGTRDLLQTEDVWVYLDAGGIEQKSGQGLRAEPGYPKLFGSPPPVVRPGKEIRTKFVFDRQTGRGPMSITVEEGGEQAVYEF